MTDWPREQWLRAGTLCVVKDSAFSGGAVLALVRDPTWTSPVVYNDEVRALSPLELLAGAAE